MKNENNTMWDSLSKFFSTKEKVFVFEREDEGKKPKSLLKMASNEPVLDLIVTRTSGIIVDGWVRLLGTDSRINNGICHFNEGNKDIKFLCGKNRFVIGHDVLGGIFSIDFNYNTKSEIYYFAPDTLKWESLGMNYTDFIIWLFQGNIDEFYSSLRWSTWKNDVESVEFNQSILVFPFLWAKECNIEDASKKVIPIDENISLNVDIVKQLDDNDAIVELKITP